MRGLVLGPLRNQQIINVKKDYENQSGQLQTVGGHAENFVVKDGFLIKETNKTEGRFYQQLNDQNTGLLAFLPQCTSVEYSQKQLKHKKRKQARAKVTLEDLRQGFKEPLIYDIKLGIKTVSAKELRVSGSGRSEIVRKDLRLHVADKVSSSAHRGYRFVGSSASQDSRIHLGTNPDEMIEHISVRLSREDLLLVVGELERLRSYLGTKEGRGFEFIGASVLIVAESNAEALASVSKVKPRVKIIDFAHSNLVRPNGLMLDNGVLHTRTRKKLYQKGFIFGLTNLIADLQARL